MTTTEESGTQSVPDEPGAGNTVGEPTRWARVRRSFTPIVAALAALGLASSATGYTIKDDIVPWVGRHLPNASGPTAYKITSPMPSASGQAAVIPRCTRVEVTVKGDLPDGAELWVGSILGKRKAVTDALERQVDSPDVYATQVSVGRDTDVNQSRRLVILTVSTQQAEWLRGAMGVSTYDIASSTWPDGVKPVGSVSVRRDSVHTNRC
ncbi:hypothetical protein [Streptomyces collinus]|uniref:hypothetical protein n=1 Tax=Streptomyces collinus TaxID=42684 RepID=UPI0036CABC83